MYMRCTHRTHARTVQLGTLTCVVCVHRIAPHTVLLSSLLRFRVGTGSPGADVVRGRIIAIRVRVIAIRVRIQAIRVRMKAIRVRIKAIRVRMLWEEPQTGLVRVGVSPFCPDGVSVCPDGVSPLGVSPLGADPLR